MPEVIEGRHPVTEALKAGRPLNKVMLARKDPSVGEIIHLARANGIPVEFVPRDVLDTISTTRAHQGIIAYTAARDYVSLDDLLGISRDRGEPPLYCILDGLEDPQNLGAILRTADAAGFHGLVIRSRREVGLTASVARASAGAVEYVPVARVNNVSQAMLDLKRAGVWITGIDPAGGTDFAAVDYTPPTAIVIGGEGQGLSDLVKKRCDFLAAIPMRGRISSLNASVAAALVMYEAFRQRARSTI